MVEVKRDMEALAVGMGLVVMDAGGEVCEHLQPQGLHGHVFSNIVLSFMGKDYALHRIDLSESSYFLLLLSGPWKEYEKTCVELKIDDMNVIAQGLEMAFLYLYEVNLVLTGEIVVSVLGAACFLCLEKLCEGCAQFMIESLGVDTFADYQDLSKQHCYRCLALRIRNVFVEWVLARTELLVADKERERKKRAHEDQDSAMLGRLSAGAASQWHGRNDSRGLSDAAKLAQVPAISEELIKRWKEVALNLDLPKFPSQFMSPRSPVPGAIPERITVNFMLPHEVEMEAQQVDMVILPPTTSHMGVLPGHVPTIAELKPGVLSVHEGDQDVKTQYFVSSGFAFIHANSVTDVIAIKAVPLDECACPERLSRKATSALKFTRNVTALNNLKSNGSQRSGRCSTKDRGGKKGTPSGDEQKKKLSLPHEVANETSLKRSAAGDQTDICMEDFCLDVELFAGWGIILPHIEVEELLQVRKEIEDADFPTSTVDKSIWLHVLFKSSLHILQEPQNDACNEFSNDKEEKTNKDEEEEEDDHHHHDKVGWEEASGAVDLRRWHCCAEHKLELLLLQWWWGYKTSGTSIVKLDLKLRLDASQQHEKILRVSIPFARSLLRFLEAGEIEELQDENDHKRVGDGRYYDGLKGDNKIYVACEDDYVCKVRCGHTRVRIDGVVGQLILSEPRSIIYPEHPAVQKLIPSRKNIEGEVLTILEIIPKGDSQQHVCKKCKKGVKCAWSCSAELDESDDLVDNLMHRLMTKLVLMIILFNAINDNLHDRNELALKVFKILSVGAPLFKELMKTEIGIYDSLEDIIKKSHRLTTPKDVVGVVEDQKTCKTVLLKANESGSATESVEDRKMAKWAVIIGHSWMIIYFVTHLTP